MLCRLHSYMKGGSVECSFTCCQSWNYSINRGLIRFIFTPWLIYDIYILQYTAQNRDWMLYGAIWARMPFAPAEITETSHERKVVCYTNAAGDVSLCNMRYWEAGKWAAHRDRGLILKWFFPSSNRMPGCILSRFQIYFSLFFSNVVKVEDDQTHQPGF